MNKRKHCLIISLLFNIISFAQTKDIIPLSNYTLTVSSEKKFYLTSEYHGVSSNNKVEEYFYRELVQKHNVRTIIVEKGIGKAYLLNQYLKTGDTSYLNLYITEHPENYKEVKEKLITLKMLNDTLSFDDKITIFGIDVTEEDEHQYMRKFFKLLIRDEIKNSKLQQHLFSIIQSDSFPNNISEIKKTLSHFTPPNDYTVDFDNIVKSYLFWLDFKINFWDVKKRRYRELYLYENILKNQSLYKGNLYGQFGMHHTKIKEGSMAYFLKNDTTFKCSIITYGSFYFNCKSYPWISMKKNTPRYLFSLKRKVKKITLQTGIYFTEHKKKNYMIHINQYGNTELK